MKNGRLQWKNACVMHILQLGRASNENELGHLGVVKPIGH